MDSLFAQTITKPLADRMRPRRLNDFAGQEKALGPGSPVAWQERRGTPHSPPARRQTGRH